MQHYVREGHVAEARGGYAYWGAKGATHEEVGSGDATQRWWHGGSLLE